MGADKSPCGTCRSGYCPVRCELWEKWFRRTWRRLRAGYLSRVDKPAEKGGGAAR